MPRRTRTRLISQRKVRSFIPGPVQAAEQTPPAPSTGRPSERREFVGVGR